MQDRGFWGRPEYAEQISSLPIRRYAGLRSMLQQTNVDFAPYRRRKSWLSPFWSADSKSIGFFAGGKLKIISGMEGPSRPLHDAEESRSRGTWNIEGTILFYPGNFGVLERIPALGGSGHEVTRLRPEDRWGHMWPRFLPDGRHFLFRSWNQSDNKGDILVGALDSPDSRVLLSDAALPAFASTPPDYLLFVRAGSLMAQRFDFAGGQPLAQPVLVSTNVRGDFPVSGNGVLVYSEQPAATTRLVWRGRDGTELGSPAESGDYFEVYLSPNETHPSVVRSLYGMYNIWLLPFDTNIMSPLTFEKEWVVDPIWSPLSDKLVYQIWRQNMGTKMMLRTLGESSPKLLLEDGNKNYPDDWSPDGKWILGRRAVGERISAIRIPADGSAQPERLFEWTGVHVDQFQFSQSGEWVAYHSDES